jgi:hypothetical protein
MYGNVKAIDLIEEQLPCVVGQACGGSNSSSNIY